MLKALKRWWKYFTAKVNSSFNEKADPKVQAFISGKEIKKVVYVKGRLLNLVV